MHMVFLYYVICIGGTLILSILYMNKFWTEEMFELLKRGEIENNG